jgi:hypothetical protein
MIVNQLIITQFSPQPTELRNEQVLIFCLAEVHFNKFFYSLTCKTNHFGCTFTPLFCYLFPLFQFHFAPFLIIMK